MSDTTATRAWARRLRLLRLLVQRRVLATSDAARYLDVSRKTALHDLARLSEHGVPLHHEGEGRERRWMLQETWHHLGLEVRFEDRLAMLFGRELVGSFLRLAELGEALDRLSHEVASLDAAPACGEPDLLRRFHCIHEPEKDYSAHRSTLQALVGALLQCRRVSFTYTGTGRDPACVPRAEPLTLLVYKRGLYLVAEKRGERRSYAIERMSDIEVHADLVFDYPRPSEYSPTAFLGGRFGLYVGAEEPDEVHLRFAREVRTVVETRRWMPGQRVVPRADGGCDLFFTATGHELASMILGFGDKAEVLAPAWLRERVAGELRRAVAFYDRAPEPDQD